MSFILLNGNPLFGLKCNVHTIMLFEISVVNGGKQKEKLSDLFANSPFFITAEEAGALEARKGDEYKEVSVPAGKTHEVSLTVNAINSYIAWDFSLVQGRVDMDIGFSMEYTNHSGQKMQILPYQRYGADQGNFCTCLSGTYKLIWDNSYSTFFKKVLRYKVDYIPPVVEPGLSSNKVDE
ncbi:hypothetical protein HAX54_052747 [Datura stramonium]|uniref:GOLD domain-containing protein n=1 Tax=Datura stramonium TaxID=4076 RepID=A0ABS8SZE8_DATST|nr:hypothetical protein [Datura stramonium]